MAARQASASTPESRSTWNTRDFGSTVRACAMWAGVTCSARPAAAAAFAAISTFAARGVKRENGLSAPGALFSPADDTRSTNRF